MHVSDFYDLGIKQPALEFLDVDVIGDTRVFVDPLAFTFIQTNWGRECVSLLQDFYGEMLLAVRTGDEQRGMYLISQLGESNEVHLGLSRNEARGGGVADGLGAEILAAISGSKAMQSGLLTDVQDTVLFVERVGHDRVSDMTIAIVKSQLIEFTQRMCQLYGIPMEMGLDSGPMWDRHSHSWIARHEELPRPNSKLILVPKAVVRKTSTFDPGNYLQHYVLPHLQRLELAKPQSNIVQKRTSKKRRGELFVTKKSLRERDGKATKDWNTEVTEVEPSLLEKYRRDRSRLTEPPNHDEIAAITQTAGPDWGALLQSVLDTPSGKNDADNYHQRVQSLLTALFYPALDMPNREVKVHEGRKRIDITYVNLAQSGFFHWLHEIQGVSAPQVIIECKNYTGKLKNPEFDQLTGRFSPLRGRFGVLCYRGFKDDKANVITHCRDAALDDRGFVIALDDEDLKVLVGSRINGEETLFRFLMGRFQEIV